jgi:hypothetical protein
MTREPAEVPMLNASETRDHLARRRKDYALDRDLYCDEGVYQLDLEQIYYKE